MKKNTIVILSLLLLSYSCYKDLGNYQYHDINEVSITDFKSLYTAMTGIDTLKIVPKINNTETGLDSTRFDYYWIATRDNNPSDTLGRSATLSYKVKLSPDNYKLNFRIIDKKTGVLWTQKADLRIGTPYSRGIMIIGENEAGNAEADMLSMVGDTTLIKGILAQSGLPTLKDPVALVHTGGFDVYAKVWAFTKNGSYYLDRPTMKGNVANRFSKIVYTTDNIVKENLNPIITAPQIRGSDGSVGSNFVRAMMCSDGSIFASYLSLNGGDFYPNPINRETSNMDKLLKSAPYLLYPIANMSSFMWYDTDNDRFMNVGSFIFTTSSATLTDQPGDLFPWNQAATKRKLVYAENTRNTDGGSSNGNSFALLKDNNNKFFIYQFYANGNIPAKRNAFEVKPIATDIDKATFFAFSSRRSLLFYAVGSQLYAYDYNTNNERAYKFSEISADPITMLKFDTQIDPGTNSLYVGTYNNTTKGTLRSFYIGTDPNTVTIQQAPRANWSGLVKIKNINWRAVN